jgi:hypothetical protein
MISTSMFTCLLSATILVAMPAGGFARRTRILHAAFGAQNEINL